MYSPQRLAYMREANRKHRQKLRGGKPPMPFVERGYAGVKAREAKKLKRRQEEARAAKKLKPQDQEGRG
jgi:hypothetical protein